MSTSEQTQELAAALAKAQGTRDIVAETDALRKFCANKLQPGRQHSQVPAHLRLLTRVSFATSTGCWIWLGPTNRFGYGRLSYEGRTQMAHRIAYGAFIGPIPNGLSVLHRCDNPSCVNPDHLWLGTYSDNRRDCLAKGRLPRRFKRKPHPLLTEMQTLRNDGLSYAGIGERLALGTMVVWRALRGGNNAQ